MREDGSRVPAVKFFSLLQEAKEGKKKKKAFSLGYEAAD